MRLRECVLVLIGHCVCRKVFLVSIRLQQFPRLQLQQVSSFFFAAAFCLFYCQFAAAAAAAAFPRRSLTHTSAPRLAIAG